MDLSIIIVNYNTKKICENTINHVIKNTENIEYEIIVTDNSDIKSEELNYNNKKVKIIKINNKGFGNACNIGSKYANGKYILFLNSDTIVFKNTLDKCVDFIKKNSDIGVLGIKTYLSDGKTLDHGCKRGFPTPFNSMCYILGLDKLFPYNKTFGGYRLTYLDENKSHYVDSVSGAFMLMPLELFKSLKGFDESIFMYGEDLDLCLRVKNKNLKIFYYADAEMIHLKGKSGLSTNNKKVLKYFYDGIKVFYKKYYKDSNFIIMKSVCFFIDIMYIISYIKLCVKKR